MQTYNQFVFEDNTSFNTIINGPQITTDEIVIMNELDGTVAYTINNNGISFIACGSNSCRSNGYTAISFNKTFRNIPKVVATPKTSESGVIALKTRNVTTTGFEITIGGGSQTYPNALPFDWIAIDM